jgi:hypothetical protein
MGSQTSNWIAGLVNPTTRQNSGMSSRARRGGGSRNVPASTTLADSIVVSAVIAAMVSLVSRAQAAVLLAAAMGAASTIASNAIPADRTAAEFIMLEAYLGG